jgi:hypothetical protein
LGFGSEQLRTWQLPQNVLLGLFVLATQATPAAQASRALMVIPALQGLVLFSPWIALYCFSSTVRYFDHLKLES